MYHFKLCVALCVSFAFIAPASASAITIGQTYAVEGNARLFLSHGVSGDPELLDGSTFRFNENGTFLLDLALASGTAQVELFYDIADFMNGGDVTLTRFSARDALEIVSSGINGAYDRNLDTDMNGEVTARDSLLHINGLADPNRATLMNIGIFTPYNSDSFSFIAAKMNAVFRLGLANPTLSIWNSQHLTGPKLLGGTDFHLTAGAEVPEPASLMLLLGGLLAGGMHRKRTA